VDSISDIGETTMARPILTTPTSQGRRPAKNRPAAQLDACLEKSLRAYAAAASAAGVSLLALAQPADAKIVYTHANIEIAQGKMLSLDLNHDGVVDFSFSNRIYNRDNPFRFGSLKIVPSGGNGILGSASVLRSGVSVGPKGQFKASKQLMAYIRYSCATSTCYYNKGDWKDITRGYLGLKFFIDGQTHYGWARLNVTVNRDGVYALLTGYAYETIANKAIITGKTKGNDVEVSARRDDPVILDKEKPKPASLGLLARGRAALDVWRKRDPADR
jgi:hypothetical protein